LDHRVKYYAFILTLIVALIPLQHVVYSTVEVYTLKEPYIVRPFYGLPYVLGPGDEFTVIVKTDSAIDVTEATLYGLNESYSLQVLGESKTYDYMPDPNLTYKAENITLKLPDNVDDGLYTLVLKYSGGEMVMPRSVIVGGGPRGHIRVFHMTDIHFGAVSKGIPNTYKNTRYIALANTLAQLYGVNLVLMTGDHIDVGSDAASHKDFFSQVNQLLVPTLLVPGNHDWAQVSTMKSFLEYLYGRYQNTLRYWKFIYGDFLFIGLDSRGVGYPEDLQLDFLNKTLRMYPDKTAIVLVHHPLFNRGGTYSGGAEENRNNLYYSWRNLGWREAQRFFKIMEENRNLVAVFSGHIHRDADAIWTRSDGSRVYFITTTTANHGYPEGYYWGAKIVDIYTNGTVRVYIPSGRPYTFTSGSINTENFMVIEHVDREHKAVTWTIDTSGFKDLDTGDITLVFYMNKSVDKNSYKLYGDKDIVKEVRLNPNLPLKWDRKP